MFEEFLEATYEKMGRQQATFEVIGLLDGLPDWEVEKIASGMPISELYGHLDRKPLTKTASLCGPDGEPKTFLDRFKGTPLFDQAVALEQEDLQAEMLDLQKRQESRANRQNEDTIWDAKDRLRVRKRLLELELAKQQGGAAAAGAAPAGEPVGDTAQGAGAPGPVPAEGVQDSSSGLGGGVAKMGASVKGLLRPMASQEKGLGRVVELVSGSHAKKIRKAEEAIKTISKESLGDTDGRVARHSGNALRRLAKNEEKKVLKTRVGVGATAVAGGAAEHHFRKKHAEDAQHLAMADRMGRILARSEKTAGLGDMIGKSLNGGALGRVALKAMAHPEAAGAIAGGALGAAGGALAGGPGNRTGGAIGGALGGAALGAGAGHLGRGMQAHMAANPGATLGQAAGASASGIKDRVMSLAGGGTPSPKA